MAIEITFIKLFSKSFDGSGVTDLNGGPKNTVAKEDMSLVR